MNSYSQQRDLLVVKKEKKMSKISKKKKLRVGKLMNLIVSSTFSHNSKFERCIYCYLVSALTLNSTNTHTHSQKISPQNNKHSFHSVQS